MAYETLCKKSDERKNATVLYIQEDYLAAH